MPIQAGMSITAMFCMLWSWWISYPLWIQHCVRQRSRWFPGKLFFGKDGVLGCWDHPDPLFSRIFSLICIPISGGSPEPLGRGAHEQADECRCSACAKIGKVSEVQTGSYCLVPILRKPWRAAWVHWQWLGRMYGSRCMWGWSWTRATRAFSSAESELHHSVQSAAETIGIASTCKDVNHYHEGMRVAWHERSCGNRQEKVSERQHM